MKLRAELMPPKPDERLVDELAALADRAQSLLESKDPSLGEAVRQFNKRAGVQFEDHEFLFYGCTDARSFARDALLRARSQVPSDDVTRDELIEIVRLIKNGDSPVEYWLALFEANVPDPQVSDLILWPNQYFGRPDADVNAAEFQRSAEQIVDQALGYGSKQLGLPGGGALLRRAEADDE